MKKILFLIGTLLLLAGCGQPTERSAETPSAPTPTETPTPTPSTTRRVATKPTPPSEDINTDTNNTLGCLVGAWRYVSGMEKLSQALNNSLGGNGPDFHYVGTSGDFTLEITPEGFDDGIYNAQYAFENFALRYNYTSGGVPIDLTITLDGLQPFEMNVPNPSNSEFVVIPGEHSIMAQAIISLAPDNPINLDDLPRGFISGGTFQCTQDRLDFTYQTYSGVQTITNLSFKRVN